MSGLVKILVGWAMLGLAVSSWAGGRVVVRGLFENKAILEVDGVLHVLRVSERSPEGVSLISATSKQAVIEADGQQRTLVLTRTVGAIYSEPQQQAVRIPGRADGSFHTPGRINGKAVEFIVDTGASGIAMNSGVALELGIDYKDGELVEVATAQGQVPAYSVTLASASVGDVVVQNTKALIIEGNFPEEILLGNSYLSRVKMRSEQGVLILQSAY